MTDLRIGLLMAALVVCLVVLVLMPAAEVHALLPVLAKRLRDLTAGEALALLLVLGILFKD